MALLPADMESCDEKKRCLGGINDGTAYSPGDECPSGYIFSEASCDCEASTGSVAWYFYTDSRQDSDGQECCGISQTTRGDIITTERYLSFGAKCAFVGVNRFGIAREFCSGHSGVYYSMATDAKYILRPGGFGAFGSIAIPSETIWFSVGGISDSLVVTMEYLCATTLSGFSIQPGDTVGAVISTGWSGSVDCVWTHRWFKEAIPATALSPC